MTCRTLIFIPLMLLYTFLLVAAAGIKKLLALHSKFPFMCSGFLPYLSTHEAGKRSQIVVQLSSKAVFHKTRVR